MIDINPPKDDNETTRHKFYVAVTSALDNNTRAMEAIGGKLDIIVKEHNLVADEFRELQTSIKTTLRIASIIITLLGSSTALMLNKTWQYADRLEKVERYIEIHDMQTKSLDRLPEKVDALKNRLGSLEDEVYNQTKRNRQ